MRNLQQAGHYMGDQMRIWRTDLTHVVSRGCPITTGLAFLVSSAERAAGVVSPRLDNATARYPATCGDAIDVPESIMVDSGPVIPMIDLVKFGTRWYGK